MVFPSPISEYILSLANDERRFAYLAVDASGVLVDKGGDLGTYGLADLRLGAPASEQAFVLEGLLPATDSPLFLPCVKTEFHLLADIHIFRREGLDWVLLLDAASYEVRQKLLQQQANQHSLLSERGSRWNDHQGTVLTAVFAALDIAVLEMVENGAFSFLGTIPSWIFKVWPDALSATTEFRPPRDDSFLTNFLVDAREFWRSEESGYLKSGPWSETISDGAPFMLEASAVRLHRRNILLIEHPKVAFDEKQSIIQKAREQGLRLSMRERSDRLKQLESDEMATRLEERTAELFRLNQVLQWEWTERTKAQRQSRLMAQALSSATEMICITDLEDRFSYVNPSFLSAYGYSEDEILGQHVQILWSPRNPSEVMQQILVGARQAGWKGEIWNRRKDMTEFPIALSTSQILDDNSRLVGLVGVAQDLTERRKSDEALQTAQRMEAIGRLAGGIAHDFNNILTVIIGYTEGVLDRLAPGHEFRREMEGVHQAGLRAAELTRKLLAISRKQIIVPRVLDLNSVLRGMEQLLKRVLREDIEFDILLAPDLWAIRADPVQMEQVILNLAVNSREAMPSGGTLTLEATNVVLDASDAHSHGLTPDAYVLLTITDTGCGMEPDTCARIFEPFFTTKAEGTGLGLATVYGIVKQIGGAIFVSSEIGAGTTFRIYLPQVSETPETTSHVIKDDVPVTGSETILLVEDKEDVRLLVEDVLAGNGYSVLSAQGPHEAMRIATNHEGPIHLVLTDIVMPGFSGRELVEKLTRFLPDARVLYMSGYAEHPVVHRNVAEKGTAFLQKPFTPKGLAEKVREVLNQA